MSQVADVLQYAADKAIESFLPVVLELLASLLEADRKALSSKQPGEVQKQRLSKLCSHAVCISHTLCIYSKVKSFLPVVLELLASLLEVDR